MGTMCGDMEPETRLVQNNKTITYVMNDWKNWSIYRCFAMS